MTSLGTNLPKVGDAYRVQSNLPGKAMSHCEE